MAGFDAPAEATVFGGETGTTLCSGVAGLAREGARGFLLVLFRRGESTARRWPELLAGEFGGDGCRHRRQQVARSDRIVADAVDKC